MQFLARVLGRWPAALACVIALGAVLLLPGLDSSGLWEPQERQLADKAEPRADAPPKPDPAQATPAPTPGAGCVRQVPPDAMARSLTTRAIAWGRDVKAADKKLVLRLFGSVGTTVEVAEGLMDAVTGLSGSGPAYVFTVIQALADGGVQAGLPRATALQLAAQTALGAAQMVLATGAHPHQLRDQVASPGGTTIRGIAELEERGVPGAFMAAVRAAAARSKELSGR